MTPDLLHELLRLVDKEIESIHDPYAWPPGPDLCDLPAEAQFEHRRLRATAASIAYRVGVAEYEEQEDRRAHGALYPSHADWLDARRAEWAPVVATPGAPTVLPSAPMAAKKKTGPGRQGNPDDSPWRSPTAAMRKTPKFSTTVPADVQARLAELATEWGTGLGGVIARLVREHDGRAG